LTWLEYDKVNNTIISAWAPALTQASHSGYFSGIVLSLKFWSLSNIVRNYSGEPHYCKDWQILYIAARSRRENYFNDPDPKTATLQCFIGWGWQDRSGRNDLVLVLSIAELLKLNDIVTIARQTISMNHPPEDPVIRASWRIVRMHKLTRKRSGG